MTELSNHYGNGFEVELGYNVIFMRVEPSVKQIMLKYFMYQVFIFLENGNLFSENLHPLISYIQVFSIEHKIEFLYQNPIDILVY